MNVVVIVQTGTISTEAYMPIFSLAEQFDVWNKAHTMKKKRRPYQYYEVFCNFEM